MELDKKIVAKRIKKWANSNFSTLKEMAEKTGISYNALQSTYLNAKSLPGTNILAKLSKHGLDINWLLSEDAPIPSTVNEQDIIYKVDQLKSELQTLRKRKERLNRIAVVLLKITTELKEDDKFKNIKDVS